VVEGEVPNPIDPPSGCRFHPRCPAATEVCRTVEPPLVAYGNGHMAACHHPREAAVPVTPGERQPSQAR
jgi:oligopeptide/dipeptide ABC transporter ATP-binding protein